MKEDIDNILNNLVVPEMEYVKTKHAADKTAEVPEVVLPKTRAEVYSEAKDRLEQKTAAVSKKSPKTQRTKTRGKAADGEKPRVKTARKTHEQTENEFAPEVAATSYPSSTAERTIDRIGGHKRIVDVPKWVGSADELVPFAWRFPLMDVARPSRFYKLTMREAKERALLLPVHHD